MPELTPVYYYHIVGQSGATGQAWLMRHHNEKLIIGPITASQLAAAG